MKLVAGAVLAAALLVSLPASASDTTYVTHDCLHTRMEPEHIMFACADGGYYVNHLNWSTWHRLRAEARGVYHFNDCRPSCAGGTFHTRRGTLLLRYRLWCPKVDRYVFRRAKVTYDRAWRGQKRDSFRLFCPL
jgi:hypothetical protein